MPSFNYDDALDAVHYIHKFMKDIPDFVIVAGSGLGGIADYAHDKTIIDVKDIPHWPGSTAPGHAGKLILCTLAGRRALIQQGRVHHYEGHPLKAVVFPVRVFSLLGIKTYIATNASGAVNKTYSPGEIIAVEDHINLMGGNPLSGPNDERFNVRFPDMSRAYDPQILDILSELGLRRGVYAAFSGPSFETPAEVRMAGVLGADLVGMSTVPEVITANAMHMRVCGLSCVSNMAAGIETGHTLTAQEVLDNMAATSGRLADLIMKLLQKI